MPALEWTLVLQVLLLTAAVLGCVHYLLWVLKLGRFRDPSTVRPPGPAFLFIVAEFFTKLINDFRHFLALLVILIFAGTLALLCYMPGLKPGLEAVTSTLGPFVGAIVGYYFGESRARSGAEPGGTEAWPKLDQPKFDLSKPDSSKLDQPKPES